MHIYPFASRQYIETYGVPKSLDEIEPSPHRSSERRRRSKKDRCSALLNIPNIEGIVALRTNTSTAHVCAIELGMGIGGLPTYIVALGTRPHSDRYRHPASGRYLDDLSSRCAQRRARVDFSSIGCETLFDPKRYPWFGDEFIHPRELVGRDPLAGGNGHSSPDLGPESRAGRADTRSKSPDLSTPSRHNTPPARAQPSGAQSRVHGGQSRARTTDTWSRGEAGLSGRRGRRARWAQNPRPRAPIRTMSRSASASARAAWPRACRRPSSAICSASRSSRCRSTRRASTGSAPGRLVRVGEALDVPVSFFFGATDAGSEDTRAILGFLDTAYSLRLLRAFSRIPQGEVQRAVVDLVESIAPEKSPRLASVTAPSISDRLVTTIARLRRRVGGGVRAVSRRILVFDAARDRDSRRPPRHSASRLGAPPQACLTVGNAMLPPRRDRHARRYTRCGSILPPPRPTSASSSPRRPDEADFVLVDDGEAPHGCHGAAIRQRRGSMPRRARPTWSVGLSADPRQRRLPHLCALALARAGERRQRYLATAHLAGTQAWPRGQIIRIDAAGVNRAVSLHATGFARKSASSGKESQSCAGENATPKGQASMAPQSSVPVIVARCCSHAPRWRCSGGATACSPPTMRGSKRASRSSATATGSSRSWPSAATPSSRRSAT